MSRDNNKTPSMYMSRDQMGKHTCPYTNASKYHLIICSMKGNYNIRLEYCERIKYY